jgi:hypothetical protein
METNTNFNKSHCESCGQQNPAIDGDGYTTCCNELNCYGGRSYEWQSDNGPIGRHCCAAHILATHPDIESFWR